MPGEAWLLLRLRPLLALETRRINIFEDIGTWTCIKQKFVQLHVGGPLQVLRLGGARTFALGCTCFYNM